MTRLPRVSTSCSVFSSVPRNGMPPETRPRSTPAFLSAQIQSMSSDVDGFLRRRGVARRPKNTSSALSSTRSVMSGWWTRTISAISSRLGNWMSGNTQSRRHAPEERVGQLLLVVRRDHDDRALDGGDLAAGLVDAELHDVELVEQIVGELE